MTEDREQVAGNAPLSLVTQVIERIWDPVETKVVLSVAMLGGDEDPVDESDLLALPPLVKGARGDGSDRDPAERIQDALHAAVARGILIALRDDAGGFWYMAATNEARRLVRSGTFTVAASDDRPRRALQVDRPDVFGLYEQNIGVVTPIMADRLTEALDTYPEEWIREAIGEAVSYNKRNWRYIQRILENWTTEGKSDEANRRDHEEHLDSEKYLRGKYASLFRRR